MPQAHIAGHGRKRPLLNKPIEKLHLDNENPRLPEEVVGKSESQVLKVLYKDFYLDELADSMTKNGYFDEEPLVAIPLKLPKSTTPDTKKFKEFIEKNDAEFTVVEGNRRLATAKLLLDSNLRDQLSIKNWPAISKEVEEDLKILPVIIYTKRSEVVPYLGVRHIVGIQKWDSYAKARYIAKMVDEGRSVKEVEEQIGDKQGAVRKNYVSYKLLGQIEEEFDFDTRAAKNDFSLLFLAIGQGNIKRYIGLPKKLSETSPDEPVPQDHLDDLRNLMSWIYGDDKYLPVIKESRDITSYLTHIVASPEALEYLQKTRDITGAYDRTDGEEKMLIRYLGTANTKLEGALGIAHRHRTLEVISEVEKCEQTIQRLLKTVKDTND
jgi:hypothetical protein